MKGYCTGFLLNLQRIHAIRARLFCCKETSLHILLDAIADGIALELIGFLPFFSRRAGFVWVEISRAS